MSRVLPPALSNTLPLTSARIGPGRSELMPLTITAGIMLPVITVYGDAGACSVTLGSEPVDGRLNVTAPLSPRAGDLERPATVKAPDHLRRLQPSHVLVRG